MSKRKPIDVEKIFVQINQGQIQPVDALLSLSQEETIDLLKKYNRKRKIDQDLINFYLAFESKKWQEFAQKKPKGFGYHIAAQINNKINKKIEKFDQLDADEKANLLDFLLAIKDPKKNELKSDQSFWFNFDFTENFLADRDTQKRLIDLFSSIHFSKKKVNQWAQILFHCAAENNVIDVISPLDHLHPNQKTYLASVRKFDDLWINVSVLIENIGKTWHATQWAHMPKNLLIDRFVEIYPLFVGQKMEWIGKAIDEAEQVQKSLDQIMLMQAPNNPPNPNPGGFFNIFGSTSMGNLMGHAIQVQVDTLAGLTPYFSIEQLSQIVEQIDQKSEQWQKMNVSWPKQWKATVQQHVIGQEVDGLGAAERKPSKM